uniref:SSK1p n=1 Tax=Ganoderma lucidum TaxID=5315 RepID=A0A514YQQ6_GANLU|nr:SSK1p [Ganoderma lucidum]
MSGARLPSVRLPAIVAGPAGDEEETVVLELLPSSRFGIAWPVDPTPPLPVPTERLNPLGVELSSSEGETDISEEELSAPTKRPSRTEESDDAEFVTPTNHMHTDRDPMEQAGEPITAPRISRAFSMPLPSQLGPFQNPRRVSSSVDAFPMAGPSEEPVHLQELSLELADSVQMVIQTLLRLSPPQVLDPTKEQFSACSLSIPTPSVSAMFTSMKNLNYMSANMSTFGAGTPLSSSSVPGRSKTASGTNTYIDFDVGEMLQSVGDALSGVAAQAGVDLVLFHDDLAMRHVAVKGDESGLSYALSHILRQIISVAKRGDSIEIGLFIESARGRPRSSSPGEASRSGSPRLGSDGPLRCSFRIAHRFGILELSTATSTGIGEVTGEPIQSSPLPIRNAPSFQTLILRRLLLHIDAQLEPDVPPKGAFFGHSYALTTTLDRGAPSVADRSVELPPEDAVYMGYPADVRIAHEPTLEQLTQFAESLRGRKVTLFAHSKGSFAQHLTSYLTSWGLDVSHVSTESGADAPQETHDKTEGDLTAPQEGAATQETASATSHLGSQASAEPVVLIDDDVAALRTRLQKIRAEQAYPLHLHARKRPSLASNHRPRSSPQVARVMGFTAASTQFAQATSPVVIVHFTSLAHFKLVKDAIQSMLTPGNTWTRLPEVIVVPKPAGPRRILTALHTAVTKPVVDPFFSPIATSPVSPSFHPMASVWSASGAQRSPGGRSPASWRTNSDRSTKSPKDGTDTISLAPSSPLGISDNMEYFSDAATATKLGSSPSSGLVIQSPDGQPAGIFFHPKPKGKDNRPSENEHSNASLGEHSFGRSRGPSFRRASDGEDGKKGVSASHSDGQRRSSRPPYSQDKPSSAELAYEVVSPPAVSKGKSRQSPISETAPTQPESIVATTSDPTPPLTAPKLPRRSSQDPRYSPPHSPQTSRTPTGPSATRRPAKRPTAESSNSAPAPIPKKGSRSGEPNIVPPISVLIVDDNPINQTILSTFMKKKKIKYDVAKNGEEAVQKWTSGSFHLILMDIQMPVMDGIQATKEIRRIEKSNGVGGFPTTPQSEGQQTPSEASTSDSRSASTPSYRSSVIIVALTASSLQSDRVAALAAGCNDFLTKPVSLHWLNNKIIEWGSIKALQMWADIRPEVVRSITTGQVAQARDVANKLHVPEGRSTPMAPRSRSSSTSRKPVSLDAAKAAAATLSKADKAPAIASPSDGSPDSTPKSIVKPVVVSADATTSNATRGCDSIPEVSSDHVQSSPYSSSNPTPSAASSNQPAGNTLDPSSQNAASFATDPLGDTPGEKVGPAPTDDDNNRPPPPKPQ